MSDPLKLMALDAEDLLVLSAHIQDAVLKPSDIQYDPKSSTFALALRRFVWEAEAQKSWLARFFSRKHERRQSVLHFAKVSAVRTQGVDQNHTQQVLSLLSLRFTPREDGSPDGTVHLVFAGEARIAIDVECVEAMLTDIGGAWQAAAKPRHANSSAEA